MPLSRPLALALLLMLAPAVHAAPAPDPFAVHTKGFVRHEGLFATWTRAAAGRLLLELPPARGARGVCAEVLYLEGIRSGLGSNPVGLDRGQSGEARVVEFRRVGARVLLEQPNLRYRAQSADSAEVRAVRESFATSVLWAGEVLAEARDGRLLVDLTPLLVRDVHGVAARLKAAGQGSFALDKDRSVLDVAACRSFPDNLEFEALTTFACEEPGPEVRATAPTPQVVSIVQHQSFVRLPGAGYAPRAWDPRCGSFEILFADYAQPIAAALDQRWLVRHRLQKLDPAAARSRVKEPIVYYVDPGAPEPIRSALVEGAAWWAQAFEAAGFVDAFRVELLPPGADPLDVRYNVIEWVHRATRGWSYGGGITDPRTGEMIQGRVTLGSLRIRQDRMILEGLAGAASNRDADLPVQLSLARIRQLAAHEVGHTLGFNHNFAASSYGGRASVMDYPAPLVDLGPDSTLDFSRCYAAGIGVWDVQTVRYAYGEWPDAASERNGLAAILRENRERGYLYLSDRDTRPAGAAHPLAAMWDNGSDPVAGLAHEWRVRERALARFGPAALRAGAASGSLAEVLVPLYFRHRYALEAAAKSVGGLDYAYGVQEPGAPVAEPVTAERQRAALAAVLATLEPAGLDLPEPLLRQLVPIAHDGQAHEEFMASRTAPAFDALGAAASAADFTLATLLPSERLARLADQHRRDPRLPGVTEVLEAIVTRVFRGAAPASPRLRAIARGSEVVAVRRLVAAAADPRQSPGARAALEAALRSLAAELARGARGGDADEAAVRAMLAGDLTRWLARPASGPGPAVADEMPPGAPIGDAGQLQDCEAWSRR